MFWTIRFFLEDLLSILRNKPRRLTGNLGRTSKAETIVRVIMQSVVSIAILGICLPILFSRNYSDKTQELAAGFIGTVVGYWLR
ncbi:MAG: hypothetical protein QOJ02_3218 [Acidobacteriota bacterium]|jgi:hypothetical protein|nr:hypothetical protein [Acidobacteriota bacterium]